jgi:ribosomal protein S18 acetylase RimI-like enzyme
MTRVRPALAAPDVVAVRALFVECASPLDFDRCFQGFERELASLPGDDAPPLGRLLLADVGDAVAGCVALRPIEAELREMKRLYVRPEFRRRGVGETLARAVIAASIEAGYSRMRLDTAPQMTEAIGLYRSLGLREIRPSRVNPITGALFREADVAVARGVGG